jgi:hypothetical protein
MQADCGLAGAGAALDDEALIDRRADDDVLLGLDRRDDLAHRSGAGGADLREHWVGDTGRDVRCVGVVELLVEVGGDVAVGECEAAAVDEPEGVRDRGAVEGSGDRRPPVDHHGVVVVVLDVPAADVPLLDAPLGRVDPAEEVPRARRAQVLERLGDGHLDVLGGDVVGRARRVDPAEALDHPVPARARVRKARSFGVELREEFVV